MDKEKQRRLDAGGRSLTFLDQQRALVKGVENSEGRKRLEGATARIGELGRLQGSTARELAGLSSEAKSLTASLDVEHMRPIATFSRARLRGAPDIAALVKSPRRLTGARLVRAARAMATAAEPHVDVLTAGGFAPDVIAQLASAADALDANIERRKSARLTSLSATREIKEQFLVSREASQMLNAVVSRQLVAYPAVLAVWNAARRTHRQVGGRRAADARGIDSSPSDTTTPSTQGTELAQAVGSITA